MKKCPYCGRHNDEEVEDCVECGTRFARTSVPTTDEPPVVAPRPAPEATARDDSWSARDAWKCLGMFVVFEFVIGVVWRAMGVGFPGFQPLLHSGAGHLGFSVVHYTVDILIVLYFARTESLRSFLKAFGLAGPPSSYIWFAVVVTLAIRIAGHIVISAGWSKGAHTTSLWGFAHSVGLERYLYLAPALMAPFGEEVYMRGFFYRAFRGSYSVTASTLLILGITAVTHWSQFHRSWIAVLEISALTVLQCLLRERTGNLWDCIISHFTFNVTGAFAALSAR